MSSEKQVAANHANSLKSTGPKSPAGRRRASLNARKHGLRSRRKAALVASGYAQEERRRKWLAQYDAQTDYDEFMISSSASLACDVERSRRVCAADVEIKSEDAEADDAERADELGDLLFLHPGGPTALYGIDPVPPDTSVPSRNRKATDPNKPSRIVRRLEKTSAGCEFLLREWKRLRALAETGFWLAPDRFRAARMLGRQPVDALEHREVAMIFVASRGIVRLGKNEFDDLRGDMDEHALDLFMLRVKARFSDLFHESTAAEYRQMLIDLADEHITPLSSKCAKHLKKATANAARTIDKMGEDQSPKRASATELELKCMNTIKRLMAPYQKEREDKPKGGGRRAAGCPDEGRKVRAERGGGGGETYGRADGGVRDPRRTERGDGGRAGGDGEETYGRADGGEPTGARDPRRTERGGEPSSGRARAEEWERTMEELDESDIRACGGYLPLGRAELASGTLGETENGTGLGSGTLMEGSDVDAGGDDLLRGVVIADCGEAFPARRPPTSAFGGTSPTRGEGAGGESVTNEANFDENVNSSNCIINIGITTNSGVDSGLDKGGIDHDFDGGETDGDDDFGEGFRVCLPPTAACGGTSPTRGEGKRRSVGEAAPTQSVGARGIEKSSSERGETFRARRAAAAGDCGEAATASGEAEEAELRELQAQLAIETVKRQARAGPMADAIRDLLASSPEAMEVLKPFLPRGP